MEEDKDGPDGTDRGEEGHVGAFCRTAWRRRRNFSLINNSTINRRRDVLTMEWMEGGQRPK